MNENETKNENIIPEILNAEIKQIGLRYNLDTKRIEIGIFFLENNINLCLTIEQATALAKILTQVLTESEEKNDE